MCAGDLNSIVLFSAGARNSINFDVDGHVVTTKDQMTAKEARKALDVLEKVVYLLEHNSLPTREVTQTPGESEVDGLAQKVFDNIKGEFDLAEQDDRDLVLKAPTSLQQKFHLMDDLEMVERLSLEQQNRGLASSMNIDFPRLCNNEDTPLVIRHNGDVKYPDPADVTNKDKTYAYMKQILIAIGGDAADLAFIEKNYPKKEEAMGAMSEFIVKAKASESPQIKALLKIMSASCQQLMFPVSGAAQDIFGSILDHGKLEQVEGSRSVNIAIYDQTEASFSPRPRGAENSVRIEQSLSLKGQSSKPFYKRKDPEPTTIHTTAVLRRPLEPLDSPWDSLNFGFVSLEGDDMKACNKRIEKLKHS